MQRYNFDRLRYGGQVMAEGIAVHADTIKEATTMAEGLMRNDTEAIRFRDNRPCPAVLKCSYCMTPNVAVSSGDAEKPANTEDGRSPSA